MSECPRLTDDEQNLSGLKFNRLSVVSFHGIKNARRMWNCRCDCGNKTVVRSDYLRASRVKSCGCLNIEKITALNRSHGLSRTNTYMIWKGMICRCHNKNHHDWENYGKRGISVCRKWRKSYTAFLADMKERPPGLTLERIRNDGNYTPSNCCWATYSQQNKNKRKSVRKARVTIDGIDEPVGGAL